MPARRNMEFPRRLEAHGRIAAQGHQALYPVQPGFVPPDLGPLGRDQGGTDRPHPRASCLLIRPWRLGRPDQSGLAGISFSPPRLVDHPILDRITSGFGGILRGEFEGYKGPTPCGTPNRSGRRRTTLDAVEQSRTTKTPKFQGLIHAYHRFLVYFERLRNSLMAPRAGFEPATIRLTVGCSTAELPRKRRTSRSRAAAYNKAGCACKGRIHHPSQSVEEGPAGPLLGLRSGQDYSATKDVVLVPGS